MSNVKTSPKNGQEQGTPAKEAKTVLIVNDLQKKIEAANELNKKVRARQVFKEKLTQTKEAVLKMKSSSGDDWEDHDTFRVSLTDPYDRSKILSFAQCALVGKFLEFMQSEIEKKIAFLDDQIMNHEI